MNPGPKRAIKSFDCGEDFFGVMAKIVAAKKRCDYYQ
jgi:hypothetical protein